MRLLLSYSAARGRLLFVERWKVEHTVRKHGYIYLHNLKAGNLQWRSPLEAVPSSLSLRTCPHRYLVENSTQALCEHSSGECSKFRFCVAAQLPFSVVKASNMPTFGLPLLLGAPAGTLWFFKTRKREATHFTLTFQCHCSYRSSAWSPVYCFHHYSLRAFLLREEQKN